MTNWDVPNPYLFPAIIIFMPYLIFLDPLSEADNQHPEFPVFCPKPVFHTGSNHKLLIYFWLKGFSI